MDAFPSMLSRAAELLPLNFVRNLKRKIPHRVGKLKKIEAIYIRKIRRQLIALDNYHGRKKALKYQFESLRLKEFKSIDI